MIYNLKQDLQERETNFLEDLFPIIHDSDGVFYSENNPEILFEFHPKSFVTLRNMTGHTKYTKRGKAQRKYTFSVRDITNWYKYENWAQFERLQHYSDDYVNVPEKIDKQNYSAIVVNGYLIGLFRNYNFISHDDILSSLEKNYILSRLSSYELSLTGLKLYLETFGDDSYFSNQFVIENIYDSSGGLKFYLEFRYKNLVINYQRQDNLIRHDYASYDDLDRISIYYNEIVYTNFNQFLHLTYSEECLKMLRDVKDHQFLDILSKARTTYDMFEILNEYHVEPNYKLITQFYADYMINKVLFH